MPNPLSLVKDGGVVQRGILDSFFHIFQTRVSHQDEGWCSHQPASAARWSPDKGMWPIHSAKVAEAPALRSQEGTMTRPQFPKNAERLSGLNRRQLLASGAAVATAIATPDAACATAVSIQTPASSSPPTREFCDATARRLAEIARRNETRCPKQPMSRRLRAAIEALPFESPKLSATAVFPAGEDFAARLERAIFRSGAEPKLIEAGPFPRDEANDVAAN